MLERKFNPVDIESHVFRDTILAVHLYDENNLKALLRKIKPLIEVAETIWLASANRGLLEKAGYLLAGHNKRLQSILVDNKWHDWSGYLAFLGRYDKSWRLIVCNDSIVTRRVMSNRTLKCFISALELKHPAIIGEVDISRYSVDLKGWSSVCWISTYLFAIQGLSIDAKQLELTVEEDVLGAMGNDQHFFNRYLLQRRHSALSDRKSKKAKLGAMFLERRLSKIAIENGMTIVNYCVGDRMRKIERTLERFLDE